MTLEELRAHVMFQTNNDVDDLDEFQPAVDNYINEGYNRLVEAYAKTNLDVIDTSGTDPFPSLTSAADEPLIPSWAHRAIADFASYMMYRNGNQYKQARGREYLDAFNSILFRLRFPVNGKGNHFYNLYTDRRDNG